MTVLTLFMITAFLSAAIYSLYSLATRLKARKTQEQQVQLTLGILNDRDTADTDKIQAIIELPFSAVEQNPKLKEAVHRTLAGISDTKDLLLGINPY